MATVDATKTCGGMVADALFDGCDYHVYEVCKTNTKQ
jgi:hypothetical protein